MGIGAQFRRARRDAKLNVTEAAARAGLSRQQVYRLEGERAGRCELQKALALAAVVGFDLAAYDPSELDD